MTKPWTICLLGLLLSVQVSTGIRWLSLFRYPRDKSLERTYFTPGECSYVANHFGLKNKQLRFCQHPQRRNAMHAVVKSAQAVAYYCPQIFKDRRWNCSSLAYLPHESPDLARSTREQAAVYALASATLMFEVARRCALGKIDGCECGLEDWDVPPQPHLIDMVDGQPINREGVPSMTQQMPGTAVVGYHWGGCADNIVAGREQARAFLAIRRNPKRAKPTPVNVLPEYKQHQPRYTMQGHRASYLYRMRRTQPAQSAKKITKIVNTHNYKAGMKMLEDTQKIRCKCQGTSGSCAHKICFREILRIDSVELQNIIKQRYMLAKQVTVEYDNLLIAKEFNYGAYTPRVVNSGEFAFLNHSPDYCELDIQLGSVGTYGRTCVSDPSRTAQSDSCDKMCCNRGYREYNETIYQNCNCRISKEFKIHCNRCPILKRYSVCN